MFKVRVKDFQSIKDAQVSVEGFTVITGPNNSGKSAFMRAVKGVFTNAAPGPLVRKGSPYLSVEIEFDNGDTVLWEKGTEKPFGKGKTINRYEVNGVKIENVGRGVPPEVEALGVSEVRASSDKVWPQIAPQFSGTLFLVDRPGSTIAEALADVERVGRLTDSLRLSERDRRSLSSELKVRRKDLEKADLKTSEYGGLEQVSLKFEGLEKSHESLAKTGLKVEAVKRLAESLLAAEGKYHPLSEFPCVEHPLEDRVTKLQKAFTVVEGFRQRMSACMGELDLLRDFENVPYPNSDELLSLRSRLEVLQGLSGRLESCEASVSETQEALDEARAQHEESLVLVGELLGGRGECPVCSTVWGCGHD